MGNCAHLERTRFQDHDGTVGWGWRLGDDYCRSYTDHLEEAEVPEDALELLALAVKEAIEDERTMLENLCCFQRGMYINKSWYDAEQIAPVIERALEGKEFRGTDALHPQPDCLPADAPACSRRPGLSVAELLHRVRAEVEGHPCPGISDSENLVGVILGALRHWCDEHGKSWQAVLKSVQTIFGEGPEGDDAKEHSDTPLLLDDLCCPKCGHTGSFYLEVTECVLKCTDGHVEPCETGDSWEGDSYCGCPACEFVGIAWDFLPKRIVSGEETRHGKP